LCLSFCLSGSAVHSARVRCSVIGLLFACPFCAVGACLVQLVRSIVRSRCPLSMSGLLIVCNVRFGCPGVRCNVRFGCPGVWSVDRVQCPMSGVWSVDRVQCPMSGVWSVDRVQCPVSAGEYVRFVDWVQCPVSVFC